MATAVRQQPWVHRHLVVACLCMEPLAMPSLITCWLLWPTSCTDPEDHAVNRTRKERKEGCRNKRHGVSQSKVYDYHKSLSHRATPPSMPAARRSSFTGGDAYCVASASLLIRSHSAWAHPAVSGSKTGWNCARTSAASTPACNAALAGSTRSFQNERRTSSMSVQVSAWRAIRQEVHPCCCV